MTPRYPACEPKRVPDNVFNRLWQQTNCPRRHEERAATTGLNANQQWVNTRDKVLGLMGSGFIIGLIGHRGPGKTQIAEQAMVASCAIGRPALYCKAKEIFFWLRRTFADDTLAELDAVTDFTSPALLIIDEIQERGETPWEDSTLTYIIDRRYDAMLDTILIANLSPDDFREHVGPSIADRLRETGGIIECTWKSFRSVETT